MTTDQTEVLTDLNMLKARMLTFPAALHEARRRADDAKAAVATLREELAQVEAETLLFVSGETVPEPNSKLGDPAKLKSAFPNEAARKAEVSRRLAAHPLRAKVAEAESEARSAALDVQRAEDEHRSYRTVADLTIAEVQLLVAGR